MRPIRRIPLDLARAMVYASTQPDTVGFVWTCLVAVFPYVILGLLGGFGVSFTSGAASAFMCCAIAAAIGENLVEQLQDNFSHLKEYIRRHSSDPTGWFGRAIHISIIFLGLFGWNMYFAVATKTTVNPSVNPLQVIAFALSLLLLPIARFIFSKYHQYVVEGDRPEPSGGGGAS